MKKFDIVATTFTTSVLRLSVEANSLDEATILALQNAKKDQWKTTRRLETTTK